MEEVSHDVNPEVCKYKIRINRISVSKKCACHQRDGELVLIECLEFRQVNELGFYTCSNKKIKQKIIRRRRRGVGGGGLSAMLKATRRITEVAH